MMMLMKLMMLDDVEKDSPDHNYFIDYHSRNSAFRPLVIADPRTIDSTAPIMVFLIMGSTFGYRDALMLDRFFANGFLLLEHAAEYLASTRVLDTGGSC